MKKFITAAAFLAASTALANAITLDDALLSAVGGNVQASTTLSGTTSASFSFTFTIDDVSSVIDMIGNSVSMSASNTPTFVSVTAGQQHVVGTGIGYSSNGTTIQKVGIFSTTVAASSSYISTASYFAGANEFAATTGSGLYAPSDVSSVAVTVVHSAQVGTTVYTTLSLDGGGSVPFTNSSTGDGGHKWSSGNLVASTLNVNTAEGVSSVYFFDSALSAEDASTVNSLAIAAIPEPSAFGLLAGAGALAFVAARRRRSRAK